MIKYYCDVCGKEIERNWVEDRMRRRLGEVWVQVEVAIVEVWNSGDICESCLLKVLNKGEEF